MTQVNFLGGNLLDSNTNLKWYINFRKRTGGTTIRQASKATIRRVFELIKANNPKVYLAGTESHKPTAHLRKIQDAYSKADDDIETPEEDIEILRKYTLQFDAEVQGRWSFDAWNTKYGRDYDPSNWTLTPPDNAQNRNQRDETTTHDDEFDPNRAPNPQFSRNLTLTFQSLSQKPDEKDEDSNNDDSNNDDSNNDDSNNDDSKEGENDDDAAEKSAHTEEKQDEIVDLTGEQNSEKDDKSPDDSDKREKSPSLDILNDVSQNKKDVPPPMKPKSIIPFDDDSKRSYYEKFREICREKPFRLNQQRFQDTNLHNARLNVTAALIRFALYYRLKAKTDPLHTALIQIHEQPDLNKINKIIDKVKRIERTKFIKKGILSANGYPQRPWSFDLTRNFGIIVNLRSKKRTSVNAGLIPSQPKKKARLNLTTSISNAYIPQSPTPASTSLCKTLYDNYTNDEQHVQELRSHIRSQNDPNEPHWIDNASNAQVATYRTTEKENLATLQQLRDYQEMCFKRIQALEINQSKPRNPTPINPTTFDMRDMINQSQRGFASLGLDGVGVDKENQRHAIIRRTGTLINHAVTDRAMKSLHDLLNKSTNLSLTEKLEGLYSYLLFSKLIPISPSSFTNLAFFPNLVVCKCV